MDPPSVAAPNNADNTLNKSSLIGTNIKLMEELNKRKVKIRRLERSIKHKDQQILSLRKYILQMKKEHSMPDDDILLDTFENMNVDEEIIDPHGMMYSITPEDSGIKK
ncbi:uncharacterized protein LOC112600325 [Melanaphis sacchari]|uniref:uncharacterized protein LOC112600325 n=1 Tax=Melanaphis sacchari TaxID=742174 RepID=UPI000DC157FD|nr:uncharacterized protein LOC112600325 [Melanaphis sacchari]